MYLKKKKKKKIWWLPDYYFNPKVQKPGEIDSYKSGDFPVYHCPKCNKAWEYGLVGKKRIPVYYDEFPTYKLKHNACPNCEVIDETD